jgi:HAD superfamily hydrolase (TIGR01549 family)
VLKAIIFDCFGVLCGTGIWNIYERAGGDLVRDKAYMEDLLDRANLGEITSREAGEGLAKQLGITFQEWRQRIDDDETPNEDVFDFIRSELKSEYKLGFLSNASAGMPKRHFTDEQLSLFDTIIVSAEVGLIKPDPKIFELAAQKLGVKPEETLFVDDRAEYLVGADQVGMQTHQFTSVNELRKAIESL